MISSRKSVDHGVGRYFPILSGANKNDEFQEFVMFFLSMCHTRSIPQNLKKQPDIIYLLSNFVEKNKIYKLGMVFGFKLAYLVEQFDINENT